MATLAPLLLGAVVTLLGTFVVQLFVVPRVEWWKRAQDRWESQVQELAMLMAADYDKASNDLHYAANNYVVVQEEKAQATAAGKEYVLAEDWGIGHSKWRSKHLNEIKDLAPRMDLLAAQIAALNPGHKSLQEFGRVYSRLQNSRRLMLRASRFARRKPSSTTEEVLAEWRAAAEKEVSAAGHVRFSLRELQSAPPPRPRPFNASSGPVRNARRASRSYVNSLALWVRYVVVLRTVSRPEGSAETGRWLSPLEVSRRFDVALSEVHEEGKAISTESTHVRRVGSVVWRSEVFAEQQASARKSRRYSGGVQLLRFYE